MLRAFHAGGLSLALASAPIPTRYPPMCGWLKKFDASFTMGCAKNGPMWCSSRRGIP